ncbi:MAG: DUF1211 domain-containing protein [Ruminococcus sp.]|nr:DUF1211 domain-containing protein [Ruminococcus sp.]
MNKGRLEAFSDGVFAIIITIIVLLFDLPKGSHLSDLKEMIPLFLVYLVSFFIIGTHWANHHHLMQVAKKVNGKIIWANHLYLFTMSFCPLVTGWAGRSGFDEIPTITYVITMLLESISYIILQKMIVNSHDCVELKRVVDESKKEAVTIALELAALICAFIAPVRWLTYILLVAKSALWVIPDLRMSRMFDESNKTED